MELKEAKEFLNSKGFILEESKEDYKTLIDKNVITDWETFGKNAFDYLDDETVEKILSIYTAVIDTGRDMRIDGFHQALGL